MPISENAVAYHQLAEGQSKEATTIDASVEGACAMEKVEVTHQTEKANESDDSIVYVGTFSSGKSSIFTFIMGQY